MNKKILLRGSRQIGGTFFITDTIKNTSQLNNFIEKLKKDNFDYPKSSESWIKKNQEIFKNYTVNTKQKVIDTIKDIFYKLVIGVYIQIRNSKITRFVYLTNYHFSNNWEKQGNFTIPKNYQEIRKKFILKMNIKEEKVKQELNYETDSRKWNANGCLMGTWKNPVFKGIKRLYLFSRILTKALQNTQNINCDFILNRRDFPIVKSDNSHPYNLENTNSFYKNPIPIFSLCSNSLFADLPFPNREDWDLAESKFSYLIDKFKWEDKIEKAVWRGNATNCGVREDNNQRLKLHQLNSKLSDYIDVGIIGWNGRDKVQPDTKELAIINPDDFDSLKTYLKQEEQLKYKYQLNVDGHVSAFRLGFILSINTLLLQVESTSGWTLWYQDKLIEHDINSSKPQNSHYILIKSDFSDLKEKIIWCRNNDKICQEISKRATQFYYDNLKMKYLINFVKKKISSL